MESISIANSIDYQIESSNNTTTIDYPNEPSNEN
ncbi:unnamed protein product, partial [Rotaria magnacalcarata]